MLTFRDLTNEHAVMSWDKQQSLFRVVGGDHDWKIDLAAASLVLSNEQGTNEFLIQWLGTAAKATNEWIWSRASERVDVPDGLRDAARAIARFGEEHSISEFTEPRASLAELNPDVVALVCAGLCEADGYYRCETDEGAEYFLFENAAVRAAADSDPRRCMNLFLSILPHIDLDHKPAFIHYFSCKGYELSGVDEDPDDESTADPADLAALVAKSPRGSVHGRFDELGRIRELQVAPPADAATGSETPS
ncbi:MAG: hypothetical protein SFX72_07560 [Isosphaeraceae bacterium]|nr:hypothetical protein [Isosphaeraceae bacterium]